MRLRRAAVTVALLAEVAILGFFAPLSAASFLQAGVNAARTGTNLDEGPMWGDVAFNVHRLPGAASMASPPLILAGYAYVAVNPRAGNEATDFNGVLRVDVSTAEVRRFITLPPWPEPPQMTEEPFYRTSLVSDGTRLIVSHTTGVDAYSLEDARFLWRWRPAGVWGTYDGLSCAAPALREGVLVVGCEWQLTPAGSSPTDSEHRLIVDAWDVVTNRSVWPNAWQAAQVLPPGNPVSNATTRTIFMRHISVVDSTVIALMSDYVPDSPAQGYQSRLQAIDFRTGQPKWDRQQDVTDVDERVLYGAPWFAGKIVTDRKVETAGYFWDIYAPVTGEEGQVFYDHHMLQARYVKDGNLSHEAYLPYENKRIDYGGGMALARGQLYAASADILYRFDTRSLKEADDFHVTLAPNENWAGCGFVVDHDILYALVDRWTDGEPVHPDDPPHTYKIAQTSLVAIGLTDASELWRYDTNAEVPTDFTYSGGYQSFAVGDGAVVLVSRSGNLTVLGRTGASITAVAVASNLYPVLAQDVTVDLRQSQPGLFGAPNEFKADWGDGEYTDWTSDPVMEHAYNASRVVSARFFARNANQSSSTVVVFQVGGSPPQQDAEPATALEVPSAPGPTLNALQRFFAPENRGQAATILALAALLLLGLIWAAILLAVRRKAPADPPRYKIERELGHGAHGRTFLARDTVLNRKVVLKQSTAPWLLEDESRRKFLREARVLARLNHPNVVTVHEVLAKSKPPTIVLEYLEKGSLEDMLAQSKPLARAVAIQISVDLLRGLEHIHSAGVLHRDIKPANILIDARGAAKVSDLGIARPPEDFATATIAAAGTQPGSPLYMSPEQAAGGKVDHRSDIYSAAAVIYEIFAGSRHVSERPDTEFRTRQRIVEGDFAFPGRRLPDRLGAVLRRALVRDPRQRHSTATALLDAFERSLAETHQSVPQTRRHARRNARAAA